MLRKIPTSSIRKSEKTSSINNYGDSSHTLGMTWFHSDDRRKEESFANRIYPLIGHDVIQKGFALKNLLPTACPCWAQRSIFAKASKKVWNFSLAYRPRSEWQSNVILNGTQWNEESQTNSMGFLIFIRNDKWVAASPSMAGNVGEEKCPPLSGCRERGRRRK